MARKRDTEPEHSKAANTLRGDVRDAVLREFKAMQFTWNMMKEAEQERLIHVANDIASMVVDHALRIIASEAAPYVVVDVNQWTVKDGVKVVLNTATADKLKRGAAVLVFIEPAKYSGERSKAEPDVVGDLRMPRGGLTGDVIEGSATELHDHDLDIPPGLRRLPPPGDYGGETPFR